MMCFLWLGTGECRFGTWGPAARTGDRIEQRLDMVAADPELAFVEVSETICRSYARSSLGSMLVVLPMSEADHVDARESDAGTVLLPDPPVLDDDTPLEQQIVGAAVAQGIDEPTELADFAIDVLDAESLLSRVPRPMSRGERQIGGLLISFGQPFRQLVLIDPTAGLDARRRRALADFVSQLAEEGARITVVTDDPLFTPPPDS